MYKLRSISRVEVINIRNGCLDTISIELVRKDWGQCQELILADDRISWEKFYNPKTFRNSIKKVILPPRMDIWDIGSTCSETNYTCSSNKNNNNNIYWAFCWWKDSANMFHNDCICNVLYRAIYLSFVYFPLLPLL